MFAYTDALVHYHDTRHVAVYHKGRWFKMYIHFRHTLLSAPQIEKYVYCACVRSHFRFHLNYNSFPSFAACSNRLSTTTRNRHLAKSR